MNTRRSFPMPVTLGLASLLLVASTACQDPSPPPAAPPLAGDGGSGAGSGGASGTAGDAGDVDGGVVATQCTDELSGISCQVEEIIAGSEWGASGGFPPRFCARFTSGDVKCWFNVEGDVQRLTTHQLQPEILRGDDMPFLQLDAPAVRMSGDEQLCMVLEGNRVHCEMRASQNPYSLTLAFDPSRPVAGLAAGNGSDDGWIWFGDRDVVRWKRPNPAALPEAMPLALPFTPVQMVADYSADAASAGRYPLACARTETGDLRCWGDNSAGSLGVGDTVNRTVLEAQVVPLPEPSIDVDVQARRACAVSNSGNLRCWGAAGHGLGLGEQVDVTLGDEPDEIENIHPIFVGTGRTVVDVEVQGGVVCAILDNGDLKCFGTNFGGVLGQPQRDEALSAAGDNIPAIRLGVGRRVLQVALGGVYEGAVEACALLDDHSVKCWGASVERDEEAMGDNLSRVDFGTMTRAEAEGFPPVVSVISPAPSLGPESASEADTLDVACLVLPDADTGDGVDADSVRVQLISAAVPDVAVLDVPAVAGEDATYTATLRGLLALPSGAYTVQCVASDNAMEPRVGRGSVAFLQDSGPNLLIVSPSVDGAVVGLTSLLHLEVLAQPGALSDPDPGAAIEAMEAVLAGVDLTLTAGSIAGSHVADVDLLSNIFEPPPSGPILLRVTATNQRGNQRTLTREVVVDDEGPVITPAGTVVEGTLVRGARTLQLDVVDDLSGTDASSVRGYVSNSPIPIVFTLVGSRYQASIDTQMYGATATQLPLRIVALDRVGNMSDFALTLRLDNAPPILSLDPPPIRETKVAMSSLLCSEPFDPVGDDSVNDRQVAPEGAEFRARIEDQNPLVGDGVVATVADVDPAAVSVYMTNDLTRPILIDTNGDGVCDELNDELDSLNNNVMDTPTFVRRDLAGVTPAGRSYYPSTAITDGLFPTWDGDCFVGNDMAEPTTLCGVTSPLTRVIKAPIPGAVRPAIWGLPLVDSNNCVGRPWDWRNDIPLGGPVCVAARAADTLGNVGVSRPLRVCLQRSSGVGFYDCSASAAWQNHNCMAGTYRGQTVSCTAPASFTSGYVRED